MRGRQTKSKGDRRRKHLTQKEETKAEEKGAVYAIGGMAAALALYMIGKCCYQRVKGQASASGGYSGVELRI